VPLRTVVLAARLQGSAAVTVGSLGLALLVGASAAAALDEAQVVSASCDGVRVRQTGVPPDTAVELVAVDAVQGGDLGSVRAVASRAGVVDATVPARLTHVARVVVEVERASDKAEIGEAATDLPQPCSRVAAPAPPQARASSGSSRATAVPSPTSESDAAAGRPATTHADGFPLAVVAGVTLIGLGSAVLAAGVMAARRPAVAPR
jgi:hypothetical protein